MSFSFATQIEQISFKRRTESAGTNVSCLAALSPRSAKIPLPPLMCQQMLQVSPVASHINCGRLHRKRISRHVPRQDCNHKRPERPKRDSARDGWGSPRKEAEDYPTKRVDHGKCKVGHSAGSVPLSPCVSCSHYFLANSPSHETSCAGWGAPPNHGRKSPLDRRATLSRKCQCPSQVVKVPPAQVTREQVLSKAKLVVSRLGSLMRYN